MNTNQPQRQHQAPKPQPKIMGQSPHEIGGSKAGGSEPQSLTQHLDGALNFIADSLFGGSFESPANQDPNKNDSSSNSNNLFADALKKEQGKKSEVDAELKKQQHLHMHEKMQMKEIFDLDKRKSEETIKQIKNELELLIKDMRVVDQSIHTAVFQEEVNPGSYHISFFTKLRNFLMLLRRRVKEGATWAQTWNTKRHKSKYQQNAAKHGSKYMFGQEGQGLTRQNG